MSEIRVSCVQMRSGISVSDNVATASDLISRAAREGAQLIATPEMTSLMDRSPGSVFAKSGSEASDEALGSFRKLAEKLDVWLLVGSLPIRLEDQRCANRSFLIGPDGAVRARYDKIHMFDVELKDGQVHRESSSFAPGGEAVVADIPGGRIGLTVCYDVRFPHLHRDLAKAGAHIIAVPAAFTRITGEAHWHILLRARAIETGSFVIAPAQEGRHEDGRETFGHSLIIGPWGDVLAEAATGPGLIHARLDLEEVARVRRQIPALRHDRAYQLRDGERPE